MSKLHPTLILSALALACQATSAQTLVPASSTEYGWATSARQLSLQGVHAKGVLGLGVIVGMLDTGLNTANPEFHNNSHVLTGYNAVDGSSDVSDAIGHGTHVAGIIGAPLNGTGIVGVAPAASLLMIKVFNGGTASASTIDRGMDYAVANGARVINLSLGASSPTGTAALRRAASSNNTVIVIAAGNESMRNPNWPGRYAREDWANGTILTVGAVDANKHLASFSNKAGDAAQFYLVAPGVNIMSSYNTGYAYLTGTSMAAPAVSGAAALVTGYWPYLRANQVAAILLNTADDLGAPGVDAVYGRGMLNVARALSPIGSYTYRVANGGKVTIELASASVKGSQPHVSTPSAFKGLSTEVFDAYGRNFTSDEGASLSAHSTMTVDSVLGRPDRMLDAAEQLLPQGGRLMRLQSRQANVQQLGANDVHGLSGAPWNHLLDTDASMMSWHLPGGLAFSAGDGGLSSMSMGLMGSSMATQLGGTEGVLINPLLGFAPQHQFASLAVPLAPHWQAAVGVMKSPVQNKAAAGDVNLMELTYQNGVQALNLSAGHLSEQGLLGGFSAPVLGLDQATRTSGLTLSGAWALGDNWAATAAWSRTHTAAPTPAGMLQSATDIASQGWGLGLVHRDAWQAGDRLSLTLSAPLRARSGSLNYTVVTGVTDQGEPIYGTHVVDLAQGAQEWAAETRYVMRMAAGATLSAAAALRVHPDNDGSAPAQLALGLRYNLAF